MVWQRFIERRKARRARAEAARRLYETIVAQARQPGFYGEGGVSDSVEGRFDLIVLHVVLVIHVLGRTDAQARALAQALFDTMFDDMDYSLRELGVGDLSVGKRVRAMAEGFYGRAAAYEAALADDRPEALTGALKRNLLAERDDRNRAARIAAYARRALEHLSGVPRETFLEGRIDFPQPPRFEGGAKEDDQ